MNKRFTVMFIFIVFGFIFGYYAVTFASSIIKSISLYKTIENSNKLEISGNSKMLISNKTYDDEVYGEKNEVELVDEYKEFQKNLTNIKQTYSDYNKKVTEYQRALNKDVTDVIDEKIFSSKFDNY
jgi:hypothetical protein